MSKRIYRFRDLKQAGVDFTRMHIGRLEKRGKFPMHFDLGENTVAWVADEVDAWVDQRIRARRVVPIATRGDAAQEEVAAAAAS